jgi:hypothetical protein
MAGSALAIEAERKAAIEAKKTPQQNAKEKKARESKAQRDARREAAIRWQREGRTVEIARPDKPGRDFNDILRGGENG